jgi:hypothetical protein
MKHIRFSLLLISLVALCVLTGATAQAATQEEQLVTILKRFVALKDRKLGWKHFSAKMVAALNQDERYADFVSQLRLYSDVCRSGYLTKSIKSRALMLSEHRNDLPYQARTILAAYSLDSLTELVKAYAEVDANEKGCDIY